MTGSIFASGSKQKTVKKFFAGFLALSLNLSVGGVGTALLTEVAYAAGGYAVSITSTSHTDLTLSLGGNASAHPYVGNSDHQHVQVTDWGDGSAATEAVASFIFGDTGHGPGAEKFFDGTWSSSHTYSSSGTYTITVKICHQSCSGAEGSDFSTATTIVVIPPPEVVDTTAPVLSQVTPVSTPTNDNTPSYTFSSTEAGIITYGGDCSSATTAAVSGNNTVTFNSLADGVHSNCTIKVTDAALNQSASLTVSSFTVDTTPPVITLLGSTPVSVTVGTSYIDAGATALDNINGVITGSIVSVNPVNINIINAYTVTYNVSDLTGNAATQVTRTVNVVAAPVVSDTTAPVIAAHGNVTAEATSPSGVVVVYTSPGTTDNVDSPGTATCLPASGSTFALGTTTVTCSAIDAALNAAIQTTFDVYVVEAPSNGNGGGDEEVPPTPTPSPTPTPPAPPSGGGGSSTFVYWGCTNSAATNFNSLANTDDGSCVLPGGNGSGSSETTPPAQGEVLGASTTTEELPLPAACAANPFLRDYLKLGKKNDAEQVKLLQAFLNEQGSALPVSGYFGPLTKASVKKFQKAHATEILQPWMDAGFSTGGLKDGTGYVYKTTKRYINMMKCKEAEIPMPPLTIE